MAIEGIGNLIDERIDFKIDEIPTPTVCKIIKIYNEDYVDIKLVNEDIVLKYVKSFSSPKIDSYGLLIFLNNNPNEMFVVSETDNGGGGGDLSNYVKKSDLINKNKFDIDLNLNFGISGLDDSIIIDMDIVDHIVNKTINIRS